MYKYSPYSGCLERNMGCIIELFLFDLTQLGGNKLDEKVLGKIEGLLFDCLECLLQIGDQVVGILGTDGQADGVLVDALVQQFLLAELAVGGGGRVDHQGLDIGYVGQQGEDFQAVDKLVRFLLLPLMLKVKMDAPPFGKYFSYSAWSGCSGRDGWFTCSTCG